MEMRSSGNDNNCGQLYERNGGGAVDDDPVMWRESKKSMEGIPFWQDCGLECLGFTEVQCSMPFWDIPFWAMVHGP